MTFFKSKCSKQPDVGVLTVTALWIFPGGRGGREKYKPPLSTFPSDYQSSNDPNKHGGSGGGGWWWAVVLIVLNARRLRSHLLLTTKVNSHGSSSKRRRRPSALVLVCLRCWEGLQRQRMDPAQSRAVQPLAKTISYRTLPIEKNKKSLHASLASFYRHIAISCNFYYACIQ